MTLFPRSESAVCLMARFSASGGFKRIGLCIPENGCGVITVTTTASGPSGSGGIDVGSGAGIIFPGGRIASVFCACRSVSMGSERRDRGCSYVLGHKMDMLMLSDQMRVHPSCVGSFGCAVANGYNGIFSPSANRYLRGAALAGACSVSNSQCGNGEFVFDDCFFLNRSGIASVALTARSVSASSGTTGRLSFRGIRVIGKGVAACGNPFLSARSTTSFVVSSPAVPSSNFDARFRWGGGGRGRGIYRRLVTRPLFHFYVSFLRTLVVRSRWGRYFRSSFVYLWRSDGVLWVPLRQWGILRPFFLEVEVLWRGGEGRVGGMFYFVLVTLLKYKAISTRRTGTSGIRHPGLMINVIISRVQ